MYMSTYISNQAAFLPSAVPLDCPSVHHRHLDGQLELLKMLKWRRPYVLCHLDLLCMSVYDGIFLWTQMAAEEASSKRATQTTSSTSSSIQIGYWGTMPMVSCIQVYGGFCQGGRISDGLYSIYLSLSLSPSLSLFLSLSLTPIKKCNVEHSYRRVFTAHMTPYTRESRLLSLLPQADHFSFFLWPVSVRQSALSVVTCVLARIVLECSFAQNNDIATMTWSDLLQVNPLLT